jgi:hypothetical protein
MITELSILLRFFNTIRDSVAFWRDNAEEETKENNEEVLKLNRRLKEKEEKIRTQKSVISQKGEEVDRYERIVQTLQNENISAEKLAEDYWRDSTVLLISFSCQKDKHQNTDHFVKDELMDSRGIVNLTSKTWLIPPAHFPERLKQSSNRNEIKEWVDEEIYSDNPNKRAIFPFVSAVDLKNIYSRSDFDDEEINDPASTLDEKLSLSRLMTEEEFSEELASNNIDLADIIESGQITFFVSDYVTDGQLSDISNNRGKIRAELEEKIGEVSLRTLADEQSIGPLEEVLSDYVTYPSNVARGAVGVAEMWNDALNERWEPEDEGQEESESVPMLEAPE